MDIKTLLKPLLDHKVKFILIGAGAMPADGYERMTRDVDVFIQIVAGIDLKEARRNRAETDIQGLKVCVPWKNGGQTRLKSIKGNKKTKEK